MYLYSLIHTSPFDDFSLVPLTNPLFTSVLAILCMFVADRRFTKCAKLLKKPKEDDTKEERGEDDEKQEEDEGVARV